MEEMKKFLSQLAKKQTLDDKGKGDVISVYEWAGGNYDDAYSMGYGRSLIVKVP